MVEKEFHPLIDMAGDFFSEEDLLPDGILQDLSDDILICECHLVSVADFKRMIDEDNENHCPSLKTVQSKTGAGTGCGKCLSEWCHLYELFSKTP